MKSTQTEEGTNIRRVIHEARESFMVTSAKTKDLTDVLTRAILVLLQENPPTSEQATELFFLITRLFQYKDKDCTLRRLIYIGIKVLSAQAENVYVVTSSLTKDINLPNNDAIIKASALRALCQIDPKCIQQQLNLSLENKQPLITSAALVSLLKLPMNDIEIIQKCESEINEALKSDTPMVQYHALAVRYICCSSDKVSLSKLITECIQTNLKSTMALCLLMRMIRRYISNYSDSELLTAFNTFLKEQLNNPSDVVEYEAAQSLLSINNNDSGDRAQAVAHLRGFLSSPKKVLRYTSLRLLNNLTLDNDSRYWSVHRVGKVCKLHLLNKRHRMGDHVVGILDFEDSDVACAKYIVLLKREDNDEVVMKQEFSFGLKKCDFMLTIPLESDKDDIGVCNNEIVSHYILKILFCIVNNNYTKTMYEDRAGIIELGPNELETKPFSCDFPIAVYR